MSEQIAQAGTNVMVNAGESIPVGTAKGINYGKR
jgi:hypothetical protein